MKKLMCFLICAICTFTNVQAVDRSKEIYVSSAGVYCDYTTIQEAVDAAAPGTTVYVRDGDYYETVVFNKDGLEGLPITLKAIGNKAVIYGTITMSNYNCIDGISLDGRKTLRGDAITVPGNGSTIINATIKNYIGNGVQCSTTRGTVVGSSDTYIAHNYVENCGGGFMLGDNSVLEYNTMNGVNTFNTTAVTGDFSRALGKNIVIRRNLYYGTKPENLHRPGTDDVHADFVQAFDDNGIECANVLIEDNRAYGKYHQGIMLENDYYGPKGEFYLHDWTVRNNLFVGFHTWAICAGKPNGGIPNLDVYNNTFVGYTGEDNKTWNGVGFTGINGSGIVKNNIFVGLFSTSYFAKDGSVIDADCNLIYDAPAPPVVAPHDIIGSDPKFAEYSLDYTLDMLRQGDFHLTDVSPCINRGTKTDINVDFDEIPRPIGGEYDIGAYEYNGEVGNIAPILSLSGLENGEVLSEKSSIHLNADVEDSDGIKKVDFYYDDQMVSSVTKSPYELELQPKKGISSVYAIAEDNTGLTTKSSVYRIFVTDEEYVPGEQVWQNNSIPEKKKSLSVSFSVVAMMGDTNSVVGISDGEAGAYSKMSCGFRVNPGNIFDAYDETGYKADINFPYEAGVYYDVRMDIDISNKTYDVYVAKRGEMMVCLAKGYRFRSQAMKLNNWFTYAESGSTRVFSFRETAEDDVLNENLKSVVLSPLETAGGQVELTYGTMMLSTDILKEQFGAIMEIRDANIYFEINEHIFETNLGDETILIDGEKTNIVQATYEKDGAMFLPLRQIFECAGYDIIWDSENSSVNITKKK